MRAIAQAVISSLKDRNMVEGGRRGEQVSGRTENLLKTQSLFPQNNV